MAVADLEIIFVVGSVRSGTSIVGQALDHVLGGDRGFFEGNVIGMISALSDATDTYYKNFSAAFLQSTAGNHISTLPKDWVKAALQNFVISEVAKPIIAAGGGVWVDKSPDGNFRAERVRSCKLLAKVFPKAKFVFCRRQGLENISSRMRKWGERGFVNHCHGWAAVMAGWEAVRPELAGRYVEVDQHTIVVDPHRVVEDLAMTLSMTPVQRDAVFKFLTEENTEQTSDTREKPPRRLEEMGWSLMQQWIFLAICGQAMRRFKYDFGRVPAADPSAPVLTLDESTIAVERINFDDAAHQAFPLPGGFQLNPADKPDQPTPVLRFSSVPAWPETRLRGALVHGACEGAGVNYTIRITEPAGGREIFVKDVSVAPGEAHELNDPFYSSTDHVDVEVSTALSAWRRSGAFTRARVVGLSCTPVAAS